MWWATAVELPALAGLFWLGWRNRRDLDGEMEDNRRAFERGHAQLREALSAYKLEVAQSYASIAYMKDVEKRLTAHLERIEYKLDTAAAPRPAGGGA
jgi:hypothetical protein